MMDIYQNFSQMTRQKILPTLILSLLWCFPGVATSADTIPCELWFDEGTGGKTVNIGNSEDTYAILMDGTTNGDGESIGPVWSDSVRFPYIGNHSLEFTGGKDWVNAGAFSVNSFTMEAWIKPGELGDQNYLYIGQAGNADGLRFHFRLGRDMEGLILQAVLWNTDKSVWEVGESNEIIVKTNAWQHVAFVYDQSSRGKLYLDGIQVGVMDSIPPISLNKFWRVGHPFGNAMRGYIDEVRISAFPRTPGDGSGDNGTLAWNHTLYREFPVFSTNTRTVNAGAVGISRTGAAEFLLHNAGNDTLNVDQIESLEAGFEVTPATRVILPGDSALFNVQFTPEEQKMYVGELVYHHNGIPPTDTIRVTGYGYHGGDPAVAEPLFQLDDTRLMATFILSGGFVRAWSVKFGIQNIFRDREQLRDAIYYVVEDVKKMGFNSIILSEYNFPTDYISFLKYSQIFAEAASLYDIGIIPSLELPGNPQGEEIITWIESGEFKERNKAFVDSLVSSPYVVGFNHLFESWGSAPPWDMLKIMQMRNYIESTGRFYSNVPAAGQVSPAQSYTVATAQLNPKLFNSQEKMDEVVRFWSTNAYSPELGVEISLAHSMVDPEYGYPEGAEGYQLWETYQRNAILKFQPEHITSFVYHPLVIETDPVYNTQFGQPRGFIMHVLNKLQDSDLQLYDPRISDFATEINGGTIQNGVTRYPVYDSQIKMDNLVINQGMLSVRITPETPVDDGNRHVYLVTDTTAVAAFLLLERTPGGKLRFQVSPNESDAVDVQADISDWVPGSTYHVSAAWNMVDQSLSLSVEGNHVADTTDTTNDWTSSAAPENIYVGNYGFNGAYPADAKIRDLRVYNTPKEFTAMVPSLQSPEDNAVDLSPTVTFQWEAVDSVANYVLQIGVSASLDSPVTELRGLTKTSVDVELAGETTYYWRVGTLNDVGITAWSSVRSFSTGSGTGIDDKTGVPDQYSLWQNYPNPFNPVTSIRFGLPEATDVTISVYNLLGEKVATLVNERKKAGIYTVRFNASRLGSGLYFYEISTENFSRTRKMIVVK